MNNNNSEIQQQSKIKIILSNPLSLALISLLILYNFIDITPFVFVFSAVVWTILNNKFVKFLSVFLYSLFFAIGQLIINIVIVMHYTTNIFDDATIAKQSVLYFLITFISGILFFYLTNIILVACRKLILKLTKKIEK